MSNVKELKALIEKVQKFDPISDRDVRRIVNDHFSSIAWSLLKDEWDNHMSETEKTAFCAKLLSELK